MSDDFVSLKMLIVSEAAPERELLRQAAAQASIPIDVSELEAAGDLAAIGELLARESFDVRVFRFPDCQSPRGRACSTPSRAAPGRPLAILIGSAAIKTREVLTDGSRSTAPRQADRSAGDTRSDRPLHPRPAAETGSDRRRFVHSAFGYPQGAPGQPVQARGRGGGGWIGAIALAKKQRFDIVFLDCQMPVIDGFAALTNSSARIPT